MIKAAFSSLAGAWIARNVEQGEIPERFAVPLTLLATRLPTPVILAGAIGYGLYRLNQEARAMAAKDVSPKRRSRPTTARAKATSRRSRQKAKRQTSGEREVPDA
jgi:hypothetical protein